MPELEITQTRGLSGQQAGQRRTLRALGLRKIHQSVRQPDRPEIRGMVGKVAHLVDVRYVGDDELLDLEPGQEPKGEGNPPAGQSVADSESAELAEATAEALAVEGSAETAADVVENPPSLSSTDDPVKPKPRARGGAAGADEADASATGGDLAGDEDLTGDEDEEAEESET